jgi:hypothetical protein
LGLDGEDWGFSTRFTFQIQTRNFRGPHRLIDIWFLWLARTNRVKVGNFNLGSCQWASYWNAVSINKRKTL